MNSLWHLPRGALHCLVTPFDAHGAIDEAVFADLVGFHCDVGARGIAIALHLGESPSLSHDERRRLASIAVARAESRTPVLIHVAERSTEMQAALARHADAIGAAAVIAPPPYHLPLTPEETVEHYRLLARATALPIVAYHAPSACAPIDAATWAAIRAEVPQVMALKDASLDPSQWRAIGGDRVRPGVEFPLAAGALGVNGHFAVCAGVAPRLVAAMTDAIEGDRIEEARMPQRRLTQLLMALTPLYPATFKAAMAMLGRAVGPVRRPLPTPAASALAALEEQLAVLGILDGEPYGWTV